MATNGFRKIRTYGEILFFVLFLMHAIAFFAFRWVETRESRLELFDIARSIARAPNQFSAQQNGIISQYSDGIIVLQKNHDDAQSGFHERNILGRDYLVYTDNSANIIVAKPERYVQDEILKFLAVLIVLYFGEVVVLLGWWFYLKDQIKELFNVS